MNDQRNTENKIKAVIFGHAVGDALGVPVEFLSREELDKRPVNDMKEFGTFPFPAGTWSDDTSMSLCALDVLADGKLDYDKIMVNFGNWYYDNEFTPTGDTFDAGRICVTAIKNYFVFKMPCTSCGLTGEASNGNGALMRINPFVLYTIFAKQKGDRLDVIHTASSLTHAHKRSQTGCGIYAFILSELLNEPQKESVIRGLDAAKKYYKNEIEAEYYHRLFEPDFKDLDRKDIKSSGYTVDTLEAALWCLLTTDNYADCVLKAVNLGDDTDTVAAIAGGLAGALYGLDSIPKKWLDTIIKKDFIDEMCVRAAKNWSCN